MIAGNIFRLIGDFFTWAFSPFEALRLSDLNWWQSNVASWIFIGIGLVLFVYWMRESKRFQREGVEDTAE